MIKCHALLKINFSHILAQLAYHNNNSNNNIDTTSAVDRNETRYGLGRIIEPQRSRVEKIREFNPRRGDTTAAVPLPKSYPYTIMELQTTRRRPDLNQIKGLILKDFRKPRARAQLQLGPINRSIYVSAGRFGFFPSCSHARTLATYPFFHDGCSNSSTPPSSK